MGTISLSSDFSPQTTTVSNIFIDRYMPQADGSYVKVYLYLLRCLGSGNSTSIPDIADLLETSERDIMRALCYWHKKQLINIELSNTDGRADKEVTSITFKDLSGMAAYTESEDNLDIAVNFNNRNNTQVTADLYTEPEVTTSAKVTNVTSNIPVSDYIPPADDMIVSEELLMDDSTFVQMKSIIEGVILGRILSATECNLIVNLYHNYHFDPELILHLFEYCASRKHSKPSASYIEKVGIDWATHGIDSVEKAKEYTIDYSKIYTDVMKAFGITDRTLGTSEKNHLNTWVYKYLFDSDIIVEACSMALARTEKNRFEYAESILKSWYDNNIHTVDEARSYAKNHTRVNYAKNAQVKNNGTASNDSSIPKRNAPQYVPSFNFEQRTYTQDDFNALTKRAVANISN